MSNQVASLTKQDKSLYVTRGSSLCLYLVVVVVVVVVMVVAVVVGKNPNHQVAIKCTYDFYKNM